MIEQKRNSYDDSDFQKIIEEIEGFEDDKVSVRAEAAGKCSAIQKRIENAKKTAKALNIPKATLVATLKTRQLERKIADIAENVPQDEAELFEDAIGQFSFLKPNDEQNGQTGAQVAASRAKTKAEENEANEQKEGAAVLGELASEAVH